MVAYGFKKQFVPKILTGAKGQTIRAPRANGHARPGQQLQLYTAMRTKHCRLILRTLCGDVGEVRLRWRPVVEFAVDRLRLSAREMDAFAQADGFDDLREMEAFWVAEHPGHDVFDGALIKWFRPLGPVEMETEIVREQARAPA